MRAAPEKTPGRTERREEEPLHRPAVGAVLALAFGGFLAAGLVALPREDAPLPLVARVATEIAVPVWRTTEPVSEIVYGTRGFDTFGETFLLLAAVVCVSMLARPKEPRRGFIGEHRAGEKEQSEDDPTSGGGDPEARQADTEEHDPSHRRPVPDDEPPGTGGPVDAEGMTVIVRVAARVVGPVLAVAGLYTVAWGYSPGGGFPAGAVMAGVVLLVYAALGYAKVARVIRPGVIETLELLGAMAIVIIGALGLILRGSFSANWLPLTSLQTIRSGGVLQVFSISELVEVATGLVLVVFAILGMAHDWTPDDDTDEEGPR